MQMGFTNQKIYQVTIADCDHTELIYNIRFITTVYPKR